MKLDTLIEGCQRLCECKNNRFQRYFPSQICPKHISESINGNQMKLDTLRECNEKKSIGQEPKPYHK